MVPPNWEHPKYTKENAEYENRIGSYIPMYDEYYIDALNDWIENHRKWEDGTHEDLNGDNPVSKDIFPHYADWGGDAPKSKYYRPKWEDKDRTWFQVYETVSEGTPVTPPFETREELIDYLVKNGDFWDQKRRQEGYSLMPCDPWPREAAERFVNETEWSCSLVCSPETGLIPGHLA